MRPVRPPRGSAWNGPQIPKKLLRDCYRIDVVKEFFQDEGGVYRETERIVSVFRGAILPINNEDLQLLPEGTVTVNSQKLYTNGAELKPGQLVRDSLDNRMYTVQTELTHMPIHGLKRYVVTRKGAAASRG